MNYNKESKLIYWGTAGCASRTNLGAFNGLGQRWTYYPTTGVQSGGAFSHDQGIPPGCEDYQIICSIRNPYTRAVSAYIDLLDEGKAFSFKEYCQEHRYNNWPWDLDLHYWHQWETLGTPDHFIRLEHIVEDWESIPQFMNNVSGWESIKPELVNNGYASEKAMDEYDAAGHQKVARFMDQEVADLIFEKDQIIFKVGRYDRDSWK
jgi:hypothetical protein